jgi:hypothetical protein
MMAGGNPILENANLVSYYYAPTGLSDNGPAELDLTNNGATTVLPRGYFFDDTDWMDVPGSNPAEWQIDDITIIYVITPRSFTNDSIVAGVIGGQDAGANYNFLSAIECRVSAHGGGRGGVHWNLGGSGGLWTTGSQGSTATDTLTIDSPTLVACVASPSGRQNRWEVWTGDIGGAGMSKVTNWTAPNNPIQYNSVSIVQRIGKGLSSTYHLQADLGDVAVFNDCLSSSDFDDFFDYLDPLYS